MRASPLPASVLALHPSILSIWIRRGRKKREKRSTLEPELETGTENWERSGERAQKRNEEGNPINWLISKREEKKPRHLATISIISGETIVRSWKRKTWGGKILDDPCLPLENESFHPCPPGEMFWEEEDSFFDTFLLLSCCISFSVRKPKHLHLFGRVFSPFLRR